MSETGAATLEGATQEPHVTAPRPASAPWARHVRAWRRPVAIGVAGTVVLRLVVEWVALVSKYGTGFPHLVARTPSVLTNVINQWDAGYYLTIAQHGYASGPHVGIGLDGYAFGPLYPFLIRAAHVVLGTGYPASAELVSAGSLAVGIAVLWRLAFAEAGKAAADSGAVLLLAWPSAFFLVAPYPEALALATASACLLAARHGRWLVAGIFAALATMSKYYLVFLVVPIVVELFVQRREQAGAQGPLRPQWADLGRVGAAVVPTGGIVVGWMLYQRSQFHNAFASLHAQSAIWHRHFAAPWTSLWNTVSDLVHWRFLDTSTASVVELFDFVTVVLLAVAAIYVALRVRLSYGLLLGLVWCVFTFETLLLSESREVLVLPPFFVAFGVLAAKRRWLERLALFMFLPCAYFLVERFVTGRFAG